MENYEKIKKIGRGTYGDVLLVRHRELQELRALKKVVLENLQSSSSSGRNSRSSLVEQAKPEGKMEILSGIEPVHSGVSESNGKKKLKDKKITFSEVASVDH